MAETPSYAGFFGVMGATSAMVFSGKCSGAIVVVVLTCGGACVRAWGAVEVINYEGGWWRQLTVRDSLDCFEFVCLHTALGAAYGTAKSGTGIAAMSVMRPELIMKSIIPVVMAGIIAIYGLVVAVLIGNGRKCWSWSWTWVVHKCMRKATQLWNSPLYTNGSLQWLQWRSACNASYLREVTSFILEIRTRCGLCTWTICCIPRVIGTLNTTINDCTLLALGFWLAYKDIIMVYWCWKLVLTNWPLLLHWCTCVLACFWTLWVLIFFTVYVFLVYSLQWVPPTTVCSR